MSACQPGRELTSSLFRFQLDTERAKFLLEHAFEEDAKENKEEAFELYAQAAELFLKLVSIRIILLQNFDNVSHSWVCGVLEQRLNH